MKSITRATIILSGSSLINMFLSLVTAKVMAVCLLPAGYGMYGLLQSFVGIATIVLGMGLSTAIVRYGAHAISQGDYLAIGTLRRAAWLLFGAASVFALSVVTVFRIEISNWVLRTRGEGPTILIMSIPLLFSIAANIQMGILNAYHQVDSLAKYAIVNSLTSGAISIVLVYTLHTRGVIPVIVAAALCNWASGRYFLRRDAPQPSVSPSLCEILQAATKLLRFGIPYSASLLMGAGIQFLMPIVVLHMLNADSVGFYRAALGISTGYLGFLVTAIGQDYYPRVVAAGKDHAVLGKLVNEQQRLVLLLAGPVILATLAFVPYLIPLLYSVKFIPTTAILEWQLIGDIFKFSCWTMSYIILAHSRATTYLFVESVGGMSLLFTTYAGVSLFHFAGLGIGFLASYVIYFVVVWLVARREIALQLSLQNRKLILVFVAAAILLKCLSLRPFLTFRAPVAAAMVALATAYSATTLLGEFGFPEHLLPADLRSWADALFHGRSQIRQSDN